MKVFVYYNLHKKCWSVKALEGPQKGKVIKHCQVINLTDVQFKVSQKGRERVIREKCKNVHAGVVGRIASIVALDNDYTEVTYNPYKYSTFVKRLDESAIYKSSFAHLSHRKVYVQ